MKINKTRNPNAGFTLIEMIGVLAVIAILAALLIPKVFSAITEAKINTVPVGVSTVKTAVIDHYAKYGALNTIKDVAFTGQKTNFDKVVLMSEGLIDKPFAPKVGASADIVLDQIVATSTDPVTGSEGLTYSLSGAGTGTNEVTGSYVAYAVINGVPFADAQAISMRIDGASMSSPESSPQTPDLRGRVKYDAGTNSTANVYIYLTHR